MTEHAHPITSLRSLKRTIERDPDTLRWFTYLLTRPQVKNTLLSLGAPAGHYRQLNALIIGQLALNAVFVTLYGIFLYSKQPIYLISAAALILLTLILKHIAKQTVLSVSEILITRDFTQENFAYKTLYQIGEFYARRYRVRSLLNTLTSADTLMRRVLFYTWIFTTLVNPAGGKQLLLIFIGAYLITLSLLETVLLCTKDSA